MRCFFLILILTCSLSGHGQIPAIEMMEDEDEIQIPFTYYYNFIVVEVLINGVLPIRLLLDTGAENSVIFNRWYLDVMGAEYEREINIMGSDFSNVVSALISRRVPLTFPSTGSTHMDLIVLKENIYHLEQFLGIEIHGILGANLFNGLVLSIDYEREIIKIKRPDRYRVPRKASVLPIEVHKGKPYVKVVTGCTNQWSDSLMYLMDTGAGLTAMIHNNTHPHLSIPQHIVSGNLGTGLGGYIKGYVGRIDHFQIGEHRFNNLITSFQALDSTYMDHLEFKRNGLIGNQILSRFDITLDYTRKLLYLSPNSDFNDEFRVDRSGIFLVASGPDLDHYHIQNIIPGSPAQEAGLQEGDQILSINHIPVSMFTMSWVARRFQKKAGKTIRLKIMRRGQKVSKSLVLRDLI